MTKVEDLNKIQIREYMDNNKNYNMNIFTYIPEGNINDMEILFIMSGCFRDALNYLKGWIDSANENKYILIAPEFDKAHYSIADHEYGNLIDINYDYCSQDIYTPIMEYDEKIKKENEWIYHIIDDIYINFINDNKLNNNGYIIYGHSSGSQFIHRFAMFGNSKYCKKYICANAGLYTFFDENDNYPYGIKNLKDYEIRIKKSLEKNVYILVGENDIRTRLLNSLPKDIAQGNNRYERATNFYISVKDYADKYNLKNNWKFVSMPDVRHNYKQTIPFVIKIINN